VEHVDGSAVPCKPAGDDEHSEQVRNPTGRGPPTEPHDPQIAVLLLPKGEEASHLLARALVHEHDDAVAVGCGRPGVVPDERPTEGLPRGRVPGRQDQHGARAGRLRQGELLRQGLERSPVATEPAPCERRRSAVIRDVAPRRHESLAEADPRHTSEVEQPEKSVE
jgi:hypothetical protein